MNTSPPSLPSPGTSEDSAESSLAEQDPPGAPDSSPAAVPNVRSTQQPVDPATGHYGPGYGDPTRHLGNDPPPKDTPTDAPPQPA